jgi:uncharacterized SAM-binding protein YcdF (DUF218 family)
MWKKRLKRFFIVLVVISLALFVGVKYQFRYVPKQVLAEARLAEPYDAIIVPGIPFHKNEWDWIMKMRVYWGVYLYREGIAKNIIFSGSAVHTAYVEAEIMALYAIELGVHEDHIFTESNALHSTENVDYSRIIAGKQSFKRLAVATDPFQSLLLKAYIAKLNMPIASLPAVMSITDTMDKVLINIDPSSAFVKDHVPLKERKPVK